MRVAAEIDPRSKLGREYDLWYPNGWRFSRGRDAAPTVEDENDDLHALILDTFGYALPRQAVCEGHRAPFEVLADVFFNRVPSALAWSNRSGGKSLMMALLIWLESVFKPGCQTVSLGGSLEQAKICYGYTGEFWDRAHYRALLAGEPTRFTTRLRNGSVFRIVSASTRATRGPHPQKLRVDEADECDRQVFAAALQMPQSRGRISSSTLITSTLHRPFGVMRELIDTHRERGLALYRWCYKEIAQRCREPKSACKNCPLAESCGGDLRRSGGYYPLADLRAKRLINERATWEVEWECRRPSAQGSVYDPELIEAAAKDSLSPHPAAAKLLGIDWGYVNPTVILLAQECGDRVEVLLAEYHRRRPLTARIARIEHLARAHDVEMIYADAAGKDENAELESRGLPVTAVNFNQHKQRGITALRYYLEQGLLRLDRSQHELLAELKAYHYRARTEEVVKEDDHGPDALNALFRRYHLMEDRKWWQS